MMDPILIRFSDLPVNQPLQIVFEDLKPTKIFLYKGCRFFTFDASFPYDKHQQFKIIFPYNKFLKAYLELPVSMKKPYGLKNLIMEIVKLPKGHIKILKIANYK